MKKYQAQISILVPHTPDYDKKIVEKFDKALEDLKKIPVHVIADSPFAAQIKAIEEYTGLLYTIPGINKEDTIAGLAVSLLSSDEIPS